MQTVKRHLIEKSKLLERNSIDIPKLEARLLLGKVVNKNLDWTYVNLNKKLSKKEIEKFEILIKKKIRRFPTAYILGNKEFYSINYRVNKNTLIPRPETELIVDEIKKKFSKKEKFSILDLGTGSGCILLSILSEFENAIGIGIDKYDKVIRVAKLNSRRNSLCKRSKFINLNWNKKVFLKKILKVNKKFSGYEKFDLIVSNPPYLLKKEMKNLQPEVRFEPTSSLYGGKNGLSFYKRIIPRICSLAKKKYFVCFEINPKNLKKIKHLFNYNDFHNIKCVKDLSMNNRFITIKN